MPAPARGTSRRSSAPTSRDSRGSEDLGFTKDGQAFLPNGREGDVHQTSGCTAGLANDFYGCLQATVVHTVGKVIAVADDKAGVGWFVAQYKSSVLPDGPGHSEEIVSTDRVGGIAVNIDGLWKIAFAAYGGTLGDAQLMKGSTKLLTGAAASTGPKPLTAAITEWFKSGFGGGASSTTARLIASGTAPSELASGAAALKLARSWDRLKLQLGAVTAKQLGGKIGWIRAEVVMPKKTGTDGVVLHFYAVVVPEGKTWRWVSLQFQSPM